MNISRPCANTSWIDLKPISLVVGLIAGLSGPKCVCSISGTSSPMRAWSDGISNYTIGTNMLAVSTGDNWFKEQNDRDWVAASTGSKPTDTDTDTLQTQTHTHT